MGLNTNAIQNEECKNRIDKYEVKVSLCVSPALVTTVERDAVDTLLNRVLTFRTSPDDLVFEPFAQED